MSFHVPEKFRFKVSNNPLQSDKSFGNNGFFIIPGEKGRDIEVMASDGLGWDHVSVKIYDVHRDVYRTPLWDEMCKVKDIFWDPEDVVVQYHPAKSEYVNFHPNVLHLWKNQTVDIPTPPIELV